MTKQAGLVPHPPYIGNLTVLVDKIGDLSHQTEDSVTQLLLAKDTANKTALLTLSGADEALELCRITGQQRERSAELAKAAVLLSVRHGATRRAAASASGVSTQTVNRWVSEAYEGAAE